MLSNTDAIIQHNIILSTIMDIKLSILCTIMDTGRLYRRGDGNRKFPFGESVSRTRNYGKV